MTEGKEMTNEIASGISAVDEMWLRTEVKKLWISTFYDTPGYTDMIVDHYYDQRLCKCLVEGSRLVSSAMMIPYDVIDGRTPQFKHLRCGYLCGLSTVDDRRGEGIMKRLIADSEIEALKQGMDMVCLIPADDKLRQYYSRLGYKDCSRKRSLNIGVLSIDEFTRRAVDIVDDDMSKIIEIANTLVDRSANNSVDESMSVENRMIDAIVDRAMNSEKCLPTLHIVHDRQQWYDIISDILRDGGRVIAIVEESMQNTEMHIEKHREENIKAAIIATADSSAVYPLFGDSGNVERMLVKLMLDRLCDYAPESRHKSAIDNADESRGDIAVDGVTESPDTLVKDLSRIECGIANAADSRNINQYVAGISSTDTSNPLMKIFDNSQSRIEAISLMIGSQFDGCIFCRQEEVKYGMVKRISDKDISEEEF
ncbi:MAG: GNAT family N-acetyltransferase, partial [Muribaculaceae bacterium]|nr:GNAT family N-acetyltransferase [Muribaculaceae bacterium]